jgi:hypothetical protein
MHLPGSLWKEMKLASAEHFTRIACHASARKSLGELTLPVQYMYWICLRRICQEVAGRRVNMPS